MNVERGIISVDPRHTVRRMRTAMQGNAIRALVELITNADDSYIRLEEEDKEHSGEIEIVYQKERRDCCVFAVRDKAEGMLLDNVKNNFEKYGAATSGMDKGRKVRGYFGQGAKDALAGMADGKICTFKNDKFVECKLFIEKNIPMYEISGPNEATKELRNTHKIYRNGTVAYFQTDRQRTGTIPQFNTVQEELANNYVLRKIMTNPKRKVTLIEVGTSDSRQLRYKPPKGKEVLSEEFVVSYKTYSDFPVHISIWRAENELTQTGDDRSGGLLLVDNENAVLGISLFKYDNEPLAARFFGEVKIQRFRELLEQEEAVLREERDGIEARHPFCQQLIQEIEKRINAEVDKEKLRKQQEDQSKIDKEEAIRYKKAFGFLNEIAEAEAQSVENLGGNPTDKVELPPNGFALFPSFAQITVGKRYALELRIDPKAVSAGSIVKLNSSHPKIFILTPEINILREEGKKIIRKYIAIEGKEPNINGTIKASVLDKITEAKIAVVPEKELLFGEGMSFQPESITLRPNQPKKVYLLVYVKMIEGGSRIKISSDNECVHVGKSEIIVDANEAMRHVVKCELDIWGDGDGENAIITANYENYMALLDVRVRTKEDDNPKNRKGMFSEPEFNPDPEPLQRTSYSSETGKVIIYENFPTVRCYLGDYRKYAKTLPAQVLVADLVAEQCFFEIAKKKVESSGTISPEALPDKIKREAFILSRKYGKKIHEALVDQNLLKDSRISVKVKEK